MPYWKICPAGIVVGEVTTRQSFIPFSPVSHLIRSSIQRSRSGLKSSIRTQPVDLPEIVHRVPESASPCGIRMSSELIHRVDSGPHSAQGTTKGGLGEFREVHGEKGLSHDQMFLSLPSPSHSLRLSAKVRSVLGKT